MKMMRWSPAPSSGTAMALVLGTLALAVPATPAAAQDPSPRIERGDCRCVDRDGKEIEHCTCFRSPDVRGILARALPLRASRARLGITITEDADAAAASRGARIRSVLSDGPADEAGLRKDDIITGLDGKSLLTPLDREAEEDFDLDGSMAVQRLMALLRDVEPGQELRVEYLRDGERRTTTVTAEKLDDWGVRVVLPRLRGEFREGREPRVLELRVPEVPEAPHAPGASVRIRSPGFVFGFRGACPGERAEHVTIGSFSARCVAGVALEKLNPKLGVYFGTAEGVLVTDVGEGSTLGLEPGDVILDVGGREATDPDRVLRILDSYEDDEAITLRIMRQKREMTVQGTVGR